MDIDAIKSRLNQLQDATSNNFWKPQPGKSQVRIVPYTHDKNNPFSELFFHYSLVPNKTVYQELLGIIADPDYGDISDATVGRDIVVERQTPAEAGNQYGKTTIRVKPNQTALADESDLLEKLLNEQANLGELYTEPTYDELKEHLSNFLNPSDNDEGSESEPEMVTTNTSSKVEDDFDKLFNS